MHISETEKNIQTSSTMRVFHGKGNLCGSAVGKTVFIPHNIDTSFLSENNKKSENEHERYFTAHARCCDELRRLYGELKKESEHAWIFLMQIQLVLRSVMRPIPLPAWQTMQL